jgi:hypothetical protein
MRFLALNLVPRSLTGTFMKPGVEKNVPIMFMGTRFKARNRISDPGTQEPTGTFFKTL